MPQVSEFNWTFMILFYFMIFSLIFINSNFLESFYLRKFKIFSINFYLLV